MKRQPQKEPVDQESEVFLRRLSEEDRIRNQRVPGVRSVLIVLSARGMPFDKEALRQKVVLAYPGSAVFFRTTGGAPSGMKSPTAVDLLIDFTGPRQRQPWFYARKLRRMSRIAVGRNSDLFGIRKKLYDRVFDEKAKNHELPEDHWHRERVIHKEVLTLAGIPLAQMGDVCSDRSHTIALELPALQKLK